MKQLQLPISKEEILNLKVGDGVLLNGTIYTGRDAIHKYLFKGGKLPEGCNINGGVLYHCGPVMLEQDGGYFCSAAGPTTSMREEPYQWKIIEEYNLRAVIGKGGMGERTVEACKKFGCIYLHAIGGAAQVYADCIKKVRNVYMLEQFGSPEAVWELEVQNFMATVTIDAHGNSLHRDVLQASSQKLAEILNKKS
jgi:tartrate/fumarate subfamily iron-sulfur-dependent hydro-lyase beta chain